MKTMFLLTSLLSLFILNLCQHPTQENEERRTTTATLLWTGEIAADGCGFEVVIGGKKYLPKNEEAIPAAFKTNASTQVRLTYIPLPEPIDRRCGMLPKPRVMDAIQVLSVEEI